ncbi:hypothetical protein FVE85_8200 [Porphyridium purpureum]|uniref:Pentatricopeptide repeat-containing protein n=1 Tax=Porphyridium purpureum TaxID=35688 RepID=A0A5J4YPP9_PORPP|nr:hypothetical protein FVE85_8200 [Porphyridium purpureum]|eukprot:POR8649..scf295_9
MPSSRFGNKEVVGVDVTFCIAKRQMIGALRAGPARTAYESAGAANLDQHCSCTWQRSGKVDRRRPLGDEGEDNRVAGGRSERERLFRATFIVTARELNEQLRAALDDQAGLDDAEQIVRHHRYAPFDARTVDICLRIARQVEVKDDGNLSDEKKEISAEFSANARARHALKFAVGVLRRASSDQVPLDSHVLTHILALARPCTKSTVAWIVKRRIESIQRYPVDAIGYRGLVIHFVSCKRPDMLFELFDEMVRVQPATLDVDTFARFLNGFLKFKLYDTAWHVWSIMREPPFSRQVVVDSAILSSGAWICARGHGKAEGALWITSQYKALGLEPPSRELSLLTAAFVHDGWMAEALRTMEWTVHLNYVLHQREIIQFVDRCVRHHAWAELLQLADPLSKTNIIEHLSCARRVLTDWDLGEEFSENSKLPEALLGYSTEDTREGPLRTWRLGSAIHTQSVGIKVSGNLVGDGALLNPRAAAAWPVPPVDARMDPRMLSLHPRSRTHDTNSSSTDDLGPANERFTVLPGDMELTNSMDATRALNDKLQRALFKRTPLSDVERILNAASGVPLSNWTLDFLLRLARYERDSDPRRRLAFAVRMVQVARCDGAELNSYALLQMLPLARTCQKVNVVLSLRNLIERQGHTLSERAYNGLISHYGACHRPDLMFQVFRQRLDMYRGADADAMRSVMYGLLRNKKAKTALEVWKIMRSPPHSESIQVDAGLLECGAYICAHGEAEEARWIGAKYREMEITPPSKPLHVLVSAFVNSGNYKEAREYMRWIIQLDYTLHERRLYQYIPDCQRRGKPEELLPLSDVLVEAKNLGSSRAEQVLVVQAFLRALSRAAWLQLVDKRLAAECAQRVQNRWNVSSGRTA